MIHLDELKEKASKATPGPWEMSAHHGIHVLGNKDRTVAHDTTITDAAFIAATNPLTVQTLIECLEDAVKELRSCKNDWGYGCVSSNHPDVLSRIRKRVKV